MDFAEAPVWARLSDRRRLRGLHGPIDLILEVSGSDVAVEAAERAAMAAFATVLDDLTTELSELRRRLDDRPHALKGSIARAMLMAVASYREDGVSPMAAVAGAVADHLLGTMLDIRATESGALDRAYVNNGGDMALYLAAGETFSVGLHGDVTIDALSAGIVVQADSGVGGIATSGWRGRSHSLGIADAVTVLASSAAAADAAATIIANAVDLPGSTCVERVAASELAPDSDLGDRLVTVGVAPLSVSQRRQAVARGARVARVCLERDLIAAARIELQSTSTVVSGRKPAMTGQVGGGQAWIT